jgi:hypothetical protein
MIIIQQPKRCGRHNEHIDRSNALGLIAQKAAPGLRRRTSSLHHVLGDRRLADLDAELEKFAVDPRRAPEWVGGVHLPNQITSLAIHRRPSGSRAPAPKQAEALTVPLNDRCG